jgi:hypothetical protein
VRGEPEAISKMELLFINPIEVAVDDVLVAVMSELSDAMSRQLLAVNIVLEDEGHLLVARRKGGKHEVIWIRQSCAKLIGRCVDRIAQREDPITALGVQPPNLSRICKQQNFRLIV